jgi:hypothetical protein
MGEDLGQAEHCRDAHAVGHTSSEEAPGHRPWRGGRLGIMGGSRRRRSAEHEVRKDPLPGSTRFRGGAECGRRRAGL